MSELEKALDEFGRNYHGTQVMEKVDKEHMDKVISALKSEFMKAVGSDNKQLIPEWIKENVFNKGYNQAKGEVRQKIKEM